MTEMDSNYARALSDHVFHEMESRVLPGPYRYDGEGRPWRVEYRVPERKHVVVTDLLGFSEQTLTEAEWESYEPVTDG